jgi:hypothetical protein
MFDPSNEDIVLVVVGEMVVMLDIRDEVMRHMVTHHSADIPSTLHTYFYTAVAIYSIVQCQVHVNTHYD